MTPRQAHALANPLNRASDLLLASAYQGIRVHGGTGLLISTVLAVDR